MAEDNEKKKKKGIGGTLDKIFMGAIIGGAIGSVLGMGLAPKKGKETRNFLKEKAKEVIRKAEDLLKNEKPIQKEIKSLANTARQRGNKIFDFMSKNDKAESELDESKKIPHEDK